MSRSHDDVAWKCVFDVNFFCFLCKDFFEKGQDIFFELARVTSLSEMTSAGLASNINFFVSRDRTQLLCI